MEGKLETRRHGRKEARNPQGKEGKGRNERGKRKGIKGEKDWKKEGEACEGDEGKTVPNESSFEMYRSPCYYWLFVVGGNSIL